MKTQRFLSLPVGLGSLILGLALSFALQAEVPQLISYQGRLVVGNTNYDGIARLKFALVDGTPVTVTTTYWSNDGSSVAGSEPTAAVSVAVTKGLYSILLGDAALPNMTPVTPDVFTHGDVRLRVWFSDGASAFKLLSPDQRIASVGYALMARAVSDGAVSAAQIAPGAVGSAQLAADAVQTANLADGTVTSVKLASEAASLGKVSGGALTLAQVTNLTVTGKLNAFQFEGQLLVPGNVLSGTSATIGGGLNNSASGLGATIAGGEGNAASDEHATVGGGTNNTASHVTATVAGGEGNQASGPISTVGGGFQNRAQGPYGTIAGGLNNTVSAAGGYAAAIAGGSQNVAGGDSAFIGAGNSNSNLGFAATIAGGEQNEIIMSGLLSAIGGGSGNLAFAKNTAIGGGEANAAGGPYATIGGGWGNTNQFGTASTLGGGQGNSIEHMTAATIGGGMSNSIRGFSSGATIPGGVRNVALGATAFAAGYRAQARDAGTFVWADGTEADFKSSSSNQFLIRASGGVGINTANPTTALEVNGTVRVSGGLALPATTDSGHGVITAGGQLLLHTVGSSNIFLGPGTGNFALSGGRNVGVGSHALAGLTTGAGNVAIGQDSLRAGTSGRWNTAVGGLAAPRLTTGEGNTAVGSGALFNPTDGNDNTAIGATALYFLASGSNNIALGYSAGAVLTNGNNNVYLGSQGSENDNETIRIGNPFTHKAAFISGIHEATVSGGVPVFAKPDGQLGTLTSSARFKQDIQDMGAASDVLLDLRPVSFRYKEEIDPGARPQFGLVAEEVEKVAPDLVLHDAVGAPYTVRYEAVNAMVLNEFLKQHRSIKDHEQTITALKSANAALEARLTAIESMLRQLALYPADAKIGDQTVAVNDRQLR